ncbi:MAG TPA: hypothetical protein VHE35_25820 [Kofleriaceae bacterium]|nr:hypothetical protein [Kofleriaceae bacterium]
MTYDPNTWTAPCLRGGVLATRRDEGVHVVGRGAARDLVPGWPIDRHELSADGQHLVVIGDRGRRLMAWDVATGGCVLDVFSGTDRAESVRGGVVTIAGKPRCLAEIEPTMLAIYTLGVAGRTAWQNLTGWVAFSVERVVPLDDGWLAVHGSGHAEQYYTVVIVPGAALLDDTERLQDDLRRRGSMRAWGYDLAVGPAGPRRAVVLKDPGWSEDNPADPADGPDEALRGFQVWDLATSTVIERVPYDGDIANAGVIGARDGTFVIARAGGVDVVDRAGQVRRLDGLAFDPHRFELAHQRGARIVIEPLPR